MSLPHFDKSHDIPNFLIITVLVKGWSVTSDLCCSRCKCYYLPRPQIVINFVVDAQLLSSVWLFVTPWTAAHQAPLSFTISWSLLKLMSTESVTPSNHLILCRLFSSCLQSFPASGSCLMSQLFASGGQSIRASASGSVLPMTIQNLFPLRWPGWISLLSTGFSSRGNKALQLD